VHLFGKCLILRFICQDGEMVLLKHQHSWYILFSFKRGAGPVGTSLQPEHRKQLLKLTTQRHSILIQESQLKESGICLETICLLHLSETRIKLLYRFLIYSSLKRFSCCL